MKECPGLALCDDFDTDRLRAEAESLGIYKQPTNETVDYIDGSTLCTDYFYIVARQEAQEERDRVSNQEFLEQFEQWIAEQNYKSNYPQGYNIEEISVANSFYMQETDGEQAVYQISVGVTYRKER
nr:MAG TPA: Minor capsid protein from bacteriophage [Caudoviricetes sp.]DAX90653.1 MAG TPA: Minor capsid protein from bacteriophage [Caudoviricetes sp.]